MRHLVAIEDPAVLQSLPSGTYAIRGAVRASIVIPGAQHNDGSYTIQSVLSADASQDAVDLADLDDGSGKQRW
jgi:hypothetical protein